MQTFIEEMSLNWVVVQSIMIQVQQLYQLVIPLMAIKLRVQVQPLQKTFLVVLFITKVHSPVRLALIKIIQQQILLQAQQVLQVLYLTIQMQHSHQQMTHSQVTQLN